MNKDYKVFIANSFFTVLPFIILYRVLLWPLAEKHLIRTEDIIAYISDYSFAFFLPMSFFLAFLLNFFIKIRRLEKRENKVWNPFEKSDKKKQTKGKISFSFICICAFVSFLFISCAGILQRTVITSDYNLKNYNFIGQVNAEFEPESIRFMKIYPEAEYVRHGGFYDIYAVIEIYINENDCFCFTSHDFDSFEKITEYKNEVEEQGIKVYVTERAYNEPDPEEDSLTDDEIILIENFYTQYESLK